MQKASIGPSQFVVGVTFIGRSNPLRMHDVSAVSHVELTPLVPTWQEALIYTIQKATQVEHEALKTLNLDAAWLNDTCARYIGDASTIACAKLSLSTCVNVFFDLRLCRPTLQAFNVDYDAVEHKAGNGLKSMVCRGSVSMEVDTIKLDDLTTYVLAGAMS